MPYGGDYNPEQWPEEIWEEDMRLFKLAHVDTVTINVFSWAKLQLDDEVYDFSMLDRIMDMAKRNNLNVCLATSTAVHPAWMAKKYPEVLRTELNGMKRKFGARHNSCPNSSVYRRFSTELAKRLALRYKEYDNIVAWHISNEYGGTCYCENCQEAFRGWLKDKYGTLEEVNRAWNTSFWGHTFYDWDEIVVPNLLSEHFIWEMERTNFQGISLDYNRFNSDSLLECYRAEYVEIKKITPHIPITTNLMGFYKPLDYQKWAKYMDFVSWDNYPSVTETAADTAMKHDLMRGLKGGKPFILMEQTPSVTNWQSYCALKRPGVMRLWSYQAVAHGSDSVMFFQMRRSIGACEKFHGALIDHAGHENTRVFRECSELGSELEKLGSQTFDGVFHSDVAILFDWDNWWAVEYSAGPSCEIRYVEEVLQYYKGLFGQNVSVDFVGVEDELSKYKMVIAPLLYMVKGDYHKKIESYVESGGTFVVSYFSGIVDEHDLVTCGGYPGKLRNVTGVWVEEIDALPSGCFNEFVYKDKKYEAKMLCDIIRPEHAETISVYEKDFYEGETVIARNQFGKGTCYYVGTRSSENFYSDFLSDLCKECGVTPILSTPEDIEVTKRINENGEFLFLLNHSEEKKVVVLDGSYQELISGRSYELGEQLELDKKDVGILLKRK